MSGVMNALDKWRFRALDAEAERDRYREALDAARRLERAYEASGRFDRHFLAAFSEFLAAMAAPGGDPE